MWKKREGYDTSHSKWHWGYMFCRCDSCMPPPSAYTLPVPPAPNAACLQNSPSSYSCMLSGKYVTLFVSCAVPDIVVWEAVNQWRRQDLLRGGAKLKLCHGLTRWTSGPGAAAAWCLVVLWLMQHWAKELWVVDICTSYSGRLHNTWIVGCQIYSKLN